MRLRTPGLGLGAWQIGAAGLGLEAQLRRIPRLVAHWRRTTRCTPKTKRKGVNSLVIILTAWTIWKHRNHCVFYGYAPDVRAVAQEISEQVVLWVMAGAKALREIPS